MRYILSQIRNRQSRKLLDNYYWQLWYRYNTVFFGSLIFAGRKLLAFNRFVKVKQGLKQREQMDPFKTFLASMMMVSPSIYVLQVRSGGRSIGVPLPISEKKKVTMGVKFVIQVLKQRSYNVSINSMVDTLISSLHGSGAAIERKHSVHKSGSLNRHLLFKVFKRFNKFISRKKYGKQHWKKSKKQI